MNYKSYTMDLAGKPLTLEFGKYCEQAAGSVWVHLGDTVVMVNATARAPEQARKVTGPAARFPATTLWNWWVIRRP